MSSQYKRTMAGIINQIQMELKVNPSSWKKKEKVGRRVGCAEDSQYHDFFQVNEAIYTAISVTCCWARAVMTLCKP